MPGSGPGIYRRILVVGQELVSTRLDVSTRGRGVSVIFADGAGAVVVGPTEEPGRGIAGLGPPHRRRLRQEPLGGRPRRLIYPPLAVEHIESGRYWPHMDGREVFRHAIVRMPESVEAVLGKAGLSPGRHHPADPAPGQPPDLRGGPEATGASGRPGLQQHPAVREHDGRHHPDRPRRVRPGGPAQGRGRLRDDGVRGGVPVGQRGDALVG